MTLPMQHQWACESTSLNFKDDFRVILENLKIRVFFFDFFLFAIYKLIKQWLLDRLGLNMHHIDFIIVLKVY